MRGRLWGKELRGSFDTKLLKLIEKNLGYGLEILYIKLGNRKMIKFYFHVTYNI